MKRNGLPAYMKLFRNGVNVKRLLSHHVNYLPSCRVCYCLKNVSSRFHFMQVFACKYICKHSLAQIFIKKTFSREGGILLKVVLSLPVKGYTVYFCWWQFIYTN